LTACVIFMGGDARDTHKVAGKSGTVSDSSA